MQFETLSYFMTFLFKNNRVKANSCLDVIPMDNCAMFGCSLSRRTKEIGLKRQKVLELARRASERNRENPDKITKMTK